MAQTEIGRRTFLRTGAALGALATLPNLSSCAPVPPGPPANPTFPSGVASGDPWPTSVILWSRVDPRLLRQQDKAVVARWEVSTEPGFGDVVATGRATTSVDRDGTLRAEPAGLQPGSSYYFRWVIEDADSALIGATSPIGRTRTAPLGAVDRVRFGVASCSNYAYGYFHNYGALAERSDLDAVIHLGDYIYEYANPGVGETYGEFRPLDPPNETVSLDDYRRRYAWYRADPDLQELHRVHPMIHVWDDHEFADDPFIGGASNHQPSQDGPWDQRVANALRAYGEWMPTRLDGNRIYRSLDYGDLLRLVMVDRQRRYLWPESDDGDAYLGRRQFDWLDTEVASSRSRWLVLGQQTTFGASGPDQRSGGWGQNQRDRVYRALDRSTTDNLVVLTGDIHRAHAMDLVRVPGVYDPLTGAGSAGVEFSCGSISSPGGDNTTLASHYLFNTGANRTYLVLDITPQRVQGDVFGFFDLLKYQPLRPTEQWFAGFAAEDGSNHLVRASRQATSG